MLNQVLHWQPSGILDILWTQNIHIVEIITGLFKSNFLVYGSIDHEKYIFKSFFQ